MTNNGDSKLIDFDKYKQDTDSTPMYFQSKNRKEVIEKVNIILDDLKGLTEAFETSIEKL